MLGRSIALFKIRRLVKKFSKKYRNRDDGILEKDLLMFYDYLSRYIATSYNRSWGAGFLMRVGTILLDEVRDFEDDYLFIIPLIPIETLYIYLDEEVGSEITEIYKLNSIDEYTLYRLVNKTIKILEEDSLEHAIMFLNSMFLNGLNAYRDRQVDMVLKTISYYVLISLLTNRSSDSSYVFNLLIYLILSIYLEILSWDDAFISRIERYGDRYYSSTFIASLTNESSSDVKDIIFKFSNYIKSSIKGDVSFTDLKEALALRWYIFRKGLRGNKLILWYFMRVLDALAKVKSGIGSDFIDEAEKIYAEDVANRLLSEDEKDLLLSAALKLYKIGLKSSFRNIVELFSKHGDEGDKSSYYIASILKNISEESK